MLKELVRSTLRKLGWDLHRYRPSSNSTLRLVTALKHNNIELVLDIGANVGQFGSEIRAAGFTGDIVSFEPLSSAHAQLSERARNDPRWTVHERCAIGDTHEEIEINISGNSVSSSILDMLETHRSAAASSAYIGKEKVQVVTLDSVAKHYTGQARETFVKIDTQGYEKPVIDGAIDVLANARGLLLELSLVPLYEGQMLWRELIDELEARGFALWFLQQGFIDPDSGRSYQLDGAFFRD